MSHTYLNSDNSKYLEILKIRFLHSILMNMSIHYTYRTVSQLTFLFSKFNQPEYNLIRFYDINLIFKAYLTTALKLFKIL